MSNLRVIENKISLIQKYLKIVISYQSYTKEDIVRDITLKGAIERYLYLVVQATVDLAEAVIAFKKFRKPSTMRECFDILYEEDIIPLDLSERLVKMVGFRNILAHDYELINYDIVCKVLKEDIEDIERFIKIIMKIN